MTIKSIRPTTPRSFAVWAVLACVVIGSFMTSPAKAQATDANGTMWWKAGLGGNGVLWTGRFKDGEVIYMWDYNGDGQYENWAYDIDADGDYDVYYWTGGAGQPPRGWAYCGEGGRWKARIFSTANNGVYDDLYFFGAQPPPLAELKNDRDANYAKYIDAQRTGQPALKIKKLYNTFVMSSYVFETAKVYYLKQGPQDERTRQY